MEPLSIADLYGVCKAEGYSGKPDDVPAMKSHLLGLPEPIEKINKDGKDFPVKDLAFEAPRKAVRTVALGTAKVDPPKDDDDSDRIKAAVKMALRDAGIDPLNGKRPQPVTDAVVSVKSGAQRRYEDNIKSGTAVFRDYETAQGFGMRLMTKAMIALGRGSEAQGLIAKHNEWATQAAATKGYTNITDATGGALVPEGYDADVIRLVKDYGVARRVCRVVPMTTDTYSRPKVTSTAGLTVYYPQDGVAGTESSETWGRTTLRAKQGVVIVKMSRAITADSAINLGEDTAREIARAVAKVEDNTLFNGTGVGTSGSGYIPNCQGLTNLIADTSTGSRTLKSGQSSSDAITLAEFTSFMGLLPSFARNQRTAFHCSPEKANIVITRLAQSQGGVTIREFMDYGDLPFAFGRPIITNSIMPVLANEAANTVDILYGDISLATDFGDRMGLEIDVSDQRYWDELNIGMRGVVRHDINVHDAGSSTVQSPVVALTTT